MQDECCPIRSCDAGRGRAALGRMAVRSPAMSGGRCAGDEDLRPAHAGAGPDPSIVLRVLRVLTLRVSA